MARIFITGSSDGFGLMAGLMVSYADFNLLTFPDKGQALSKITDLTMLTDILPTGFHGALTAGVIMIGDLNEARLSHAKKVGFVLIDLSKHDRLGEQAATVVGEPTVDSVIDAVGFEAKGQPDVSGRTRGTNRSAIRHFSMAA